ncbi:unnamed protein product [Sphagnum balticum]
MNNSSTPVDNINNGDDIIQFFPTNNSGNSFDEQFALVRVGDIVRINYGGVEVQFVILEKKYNQDFLGNKTFIIRIAGKNLDYTASATARIDRPLFNNNKYGVLATAGINGVSGGAGYPASLIIGMARGAQALGVDFSSDEFNETHYSLYLVLYPNGNPANGQIVLPGIDVTGNQGTTPGAYTLDGIVAATNAAFRQPGFNYRFIAFEYQGNFGIMLADSYNNAAFSIISAVVKADGTYDSTNTAILYPNNVIDVFPTVASAAPDPLGFGPANANIASPLFQSSYSSANQAIIPTQIFVPLRRNNYYVNGVERERMSTDVGQLLDVYGDGYWIGEIQTNPIVIPGPNGRVQTTYVINQDLSTSQLKVGKTLVVQTFNEGGSFVDFGRFIISNVEFGVCGPFTTSITVYDAVSGQGASPVPTAGVGTTLAIYFSFDSVSFNNESATDYNSILPFKRHFEVYVDENGATYTHERGRMFYGAGTGSPPSITVNSIPLYTSSLLSNFDIVRISPKLRGFTSGTVTKISLSITSYNQTSGVYTGYLAYYNGVSFSDQGPTISGKRGEVTRFYDYTNIDYVDINLDIGPSLNTLATFTNQVIDIQLFPTLSLDEQIMMISTCQLNDSTQVINQVTDQRQFGNTSEQEFTTSALNYIALPERLLHFNGPVRGFQLVSTNNEFITMQGGLALVGGSFQAVNQQIVTVPKVQEFYGAAYYPVNFALCINSGGEFVLLPLTDATSTTPPVAARVVNLFNVVSNTTYNADSCTFSYLLNDRKDLAVLYIVSSVVTGSGSGATVALTYSDVRRFINDSDSNVPAVLTTDNSEGNFQAVSTALNWLRFNSQFQQQLQVKGSYTIASDPGFNGSPGLHVTGNSSTASLNFTGAAYISGVTFSNLTISTNSLLSLNTSSGTIVGPVVFNNCNFTITTGQAFAIGSNVTFNGCTFTYNFNASVNANDLVNAYTGMMYTSVGVNGVLQNFTVTNNTFISVFANHFSFVSLQLNDYTSILENINISGNTFISQTPEDLRAVIAITTTSSLQSPNTAFPLNPKVINLAINDNVCNQDQMIVITAYPSTTSSPVGAMTGSGPSPINCHISRNICGAIGYWTPANDAADFFNTANTIVIRDKADSLTISYNTCKVICTMNTYGQYQPFGYLYFTGSIFEAKQGVQVPTGQVDIVGNTVNWISAGCYGTTAAPGAGTRILDNKVSPFNSNFIYNYFNTTISTAPIGLPNFGISLYGIGTGGTGTENTQSIIRGNLLQQVPLEQNTNPASISGPYYWPSGILSAANTQITGNVVNGVVNSNSLIYLSGNTSTWLVTHNVLSRAGQTVLAFVEGAAGSNTLSIITDNIFDSLYTDASNTIYNDVGNNIPPSWNYTNNSNQVSYVAAPIYDYFSGGGSPPGASAPFIGSPNNGNPVLGSLQTSWQTNGSSGNFNWQFTARLGDMLPQGVHLLYVTVGMFNYVNQSAGALTTAVGSSIQMSINFNSPNSIPTPTTTPSAPATPSSFPALVNTLADVANIESSLLYQFAPTSAFLSLGTAAPGPANLANLQNGTVFFLLDMSAASQQAYTGQEHEIMFAINMKSITWTGGEADIDLSPIILRYAWV